MLKQIGTTLLAAALGLGLNDPHGPPGDPPRKDRLDVLFINGTVIDGTGAQRYQADVGIKGDSIHVIGQDLEKQYEAERVIDISGKLIAPGYIDVHTHADPVVFGNNSRQKAALNLLYQGITTVNVGADGRHWKKYADQKEGQISKLYDYVDQNGFGMNVFILLGHNNIRQAVLGENDKRFSTKAEQEEMATYVRRYMEEGALGMSLGLEYASGRYADVDELIHLARVLAEYDERAVIIAHERATGPQHRYYLPSEHNAKGLYTDRFRKYPNGWDVLDYVKEGIAIAESSGVVFDFSHMKITHQSYWGKSAEVIDLINAARARGVKVYAEHMPFTNSGNTPMNLSIIPAKYYRTKEKVYPYAALERILADSKQAELLRKDIAWEIDKHGGAHSVEIIEIASHPEWIGKTLADLSTEWGLPDPVDVVLRVKREGDADKVNGARYRSRETLSFEDVANFARQDWVGTVTDGGVVGLTGGFAQPRYFASFTNKITLLVKEKGVISLEHAIRAGTGLPAEMLSLPDRGLIKVGYKADIQVFDLDELEVKARWSLENSRAYSEGIHYVLVNGRFALDEKKPTYVLAGRSIRNQDVWAPRPARATAATR